MKKNKLIGILVASTGAIASISTAAALYVKSATKTGFGIGAKWSGLSGTVTYLIDGKASGSMEAHYLDKDGNNGGEGFGGAYTQAEFIFPVGASFSDDVPAQNVVVGNFEVDLTNISEALQNKAKIWVGVNGYTADTYGASHYSKAFMANDTALTGEAYSVNHDIAVSSAGTQSVCVYVKLDQALSESDLFALAEGKAFDISVSWGAPTDFEFAHVVGNKTMWEDDDVYAMVPNINKENAKAYDEEEHPSVEVFEWMFNNLPASMEKTKCRKVASKEPEITYNWSKDDKELEAGNVYDVYWSGANGAEAYYTANPIVG